MKNDFYFNVMVTLTNSSLASGISRNASLTKQWMIES